MIRDLARRMARGRTLVNVAYAAQRGERGEQAVFAALTLAAFLGRIGSPGGGFAHGFGSMGDYGVGVAGPPLPTFPQGSNPVPDFIPCARISDLLLDPGATIPYDGGVVRFPDTRLVHWAGGNPFHHHQDLKRLLRAMSTVDTTVVDETHWTATARHADVVLPAASSLERDDLAAGAGDRRLRAVRRVLEPVGQAREEFWIHARLAERLGAGGGVHRGARLARLAGADPRAVAGRARLAARAVVRPVLARRRRRPARRAVPGRGVHRLPRRSGAVPAGHAQREAGAGLGRDRRVRAAGRRRARWGPGQSKEQTR